jgi:hypothetical protein
MKTSSPIEVLESRIAPAALVGNVLTYTDVDGDIVSVTFATEAQLTPEVFSFDTAFDSTGPQQLQKIDLSNRFDADGVSIITKLTPGGAGDGRADVGFIDAQGIDLGKVSLSGDLGRIVAGDADTTPAIKCLAVYSMGVAGLSTQAADATLVSSISGSVGSIKVVTDFVDASIDLPLLNGRGSKIGSLSIGGDLTGGSAIGSGSISVSGSISKVAVLGAIEGGDAASTGVISAGALGSVLIGHASKSALRDASIVAIQGGQGPDSGVIVAQNSIKKIEVFGSVAGEGASSGAIISTSGGIGCVTIHGSLVGGSGDRSGAIGADLAIGKVIVTSDLIGGLGSSSGSIEGTGGIGSLSIGEDVVGGSTFNTGTISSQRSIGSVHIGGDLLGGLGMMSGGIRPDGTLGTVAIDGSVLGGAGDQSGIIRAGLIQSVMIEHNLSAGAGLRSGMIESDNSIGVVKIAGDATGTPAVPATLVARGAFKPGATDIAIGGVQIGGRAEFLNILAGFDETTLVISQQIHPAVNGNAQIKCVRIGGTAMGVNIVAGVLPGQDGKFGTQDDAAFGDVIDVTDPLIGKVTVVGQWLATDATDDSYLVTADRVLKASVNGASVTLSASDDIETIALNPDTNLVEFA